MPNTIRVSEDMPIRVRAALEATINDAWQEWLTLPDEDDDPDGFWTYLTGGGVNTGPTTYPYTLED
jgi:hypothetical protein